MIAQDTGSAIVGPARADIYWGAGDDAGRIAGRTRQQGRFVILLPRELDMIAAGKAMPLPQPKPTISHEIVANGDRAHGYRQNRTKLAENTEADKPPNGNAAKAGDHKNSVVDRRQQQQPARKGAKPRSREGVANKEDGDHADGHQKNRAKSLAEKTQAEKVPTVHAQKVEDYKKSLSNLRQQTHPAGRGTTNSRS
jgi:hypothetical protein